MDARHGTAGQLLSEPVSIHSQTGISHGEEETAVGGCGLCCNNNVLFDITNDLTKISPPSIVLQLIDYDMNDLFLPLH
jgi:hypothetical protein